MDGARLTEQGTSRDESFLYFITVGTCDVVVDGRRVAELGPGDIVGELGLLAAEDKSGSSATVVAQGSVRCLSIPVAKVREAFSADPKTSAAFERVAIDSLKSKVDSMYDQLRDQNYRAVLEVACQLDDVDGISARVAEHRRANGISAETHARLLDELPQCGHRPF